MKEVKATIVVNDLKDYEKLLENPLIKFDETLKLEIDLNKISKNSFIRLLEIMDENRYRVKNNLDNPKVTESEIIDNTMKDVLEMKGMTNSKDSIPSLELIEKMRKSVLPLNEYRSKTNNEVDSTSKIKDDNYYSLQKVISILTGVDVGGRALSFINEKLIEFGYLAYRLDDSKQTRVIRNTDKTKNISTNVGTNVNWKLDGIKDILEQLFVMDDLIWKIKNIKDNPVLQSGKDATKKRLEKYVKLGYKTTDDLLSEVYKLTDKTRLQVVKIFNSILCAHGYLIYNPRQGKTYDIPGDSDKLVRIDSTFYWKGDISVEFDSKGVYNELLDKLTKE